MPERLAIVCNSVPPYRAHFHRRVVEEMPELRLHTLVSHTDARWPTVEMPEINLHRFDGGDDVFRQHLPLRSWREWRRAGRMIQFLRRERVDAVLIQGYNEVGRLRLLNWASRSGLRVLFWSDSNVHGDHARGLKLLVKRALLGWVQRRCDAILVCGRLGRAYWRRYGVPDEKLFVSPVEPDYAAFAGEAGGVNEDPPAGLADCPGVDRWLLYSGRLTEVKRVDRLIDAFNALAPEFPGWGLAVAGSGDLEPALRARVDPAAADRVRWLGFVPSEERLAAVYRACDVLVLPSSYEPWALVVNEAAAAGLALVATGVVGAAPELIRSGRNGWVVPEGDQEALVEAVRETMRNIEQRKAASAAVLADWRRDGDPIEGLRRALETAEAK